MNSLELFFLVLLAIQFFHSIEELSTGFHRRFPLRKMKFTTFLCLEILFFGWWILIFWLKQFEYRDQLLAFFNLLMFANGLWHLVWWGIVKKYVPGLATAPLFIIAFIIFYLQLFI